MSVLGWCFLIGGIGVLWLLIAFIYISTRAAVSPREAKSAGSAETGLTYRTAKANGVAAPEAADAGTEPISEGLGATAPEGAPHTLSGATPDLVDIDLDGPGFADLAQLDFLEAWRRAGCPAVWPIPVVPGKDAA